MSLFPINSNERFVSNISRARRGIAEIRDIEDIFSRRLGKIEGARGPKVVRSIGTSESDLRVLKAGGTQKLGPMFFRSFYRLESNHTMIGVESEDGKSFTPSSIGSGLPPGNVKQRNRLRWRTREALVNAIRSIATDVSSIPSVDVLEMRCAGTEFMGLPIVKRNNILHLQHTIMLERAEYEDQATLLQLLKRDDAPQCEPLEMPAWILKSDLSLDALASAIKFIAFDEITLYFQRMAWDRYTGKVDPSIPQAILVRKNSPILKHKQLRLERLKKELGQPAAV